MDLLSYDQVKAALACPVQDVAGELARKPASLVGCEHVRIKRETQSGRCCVTCECGASWFEYPLLVAKAGSK